MDRHGKPPPTRRVLLFESSISPAALRSYRAIARYATASRWNLQTIEYDVRDDLLKTRTMHGAPDIAGLVDLWRPDGIIVECAGRAPQLPVARFGRLPVVLLDCPRPCSGSRLCSVSAGNADIAKEAARELLSLGFSHYAFLPYPAQTDWSRERGDEFRRLVTVAGGDCRVMDSSAGCQMDTGNFLRDLSRQILGMPRPCGVFAANDEIAKLLVTACETADLKVPDDVAVVGVDNDERFCENTAVTLSSIAVDNDETGVCAARLLSEMMCGGRRKTSSVVCQSVRLVRRMSSTRFPITDARMTRVMESIRLNACKGITPAAVAREMGCSRRFADIRFVSALGRTVQEQIRSIRLEQVKALLYDETVGLAEISGLCGYGSQSDFCRDFRKRTGTTPRQWRNNVLKM